MIQADALNLLKTGASVFLTGEPGSGKTHTIRAYISYLREHGIEPAVTAATGIAATHIGGVTLHSWSGMGISHDPSGRTRVFWREAAAKKIIKTKVLIVDEISMLSAETITHLDRICKNAKDNTEPFGGLQIIFVGDFFQLPPITERHTTEKQASEHRASIFAFASSAWQDLNPQICYLTEQHRQSDENFLAALSAIREGVFGEEHLECFASRRVRPDHVPEGIPKLFSHNLDVDRVNHQKLSLLPGKQYAFQMSSRGKKNLIEALKKGCLSPERLELKIGASVMFTKNNPKQGFVNGTLGTVEDFDTATRVPLVRTKENKRIFVSPMEWAVEQNGKVRAAIAQFPLRLAWAITVHKSQGMSLDAAVMDLQSVFEFGQGYVALSRVRTLAGLHLLGWNERTFKVHPEILEKDAEFRAASEACVRSIQQTSSADLARAHENFLSSSGGTLAAVAVPEKTSSSKPAKTKTHHTTLVLWNEGKNIQQIAESRNIKEQTVLSHIEKLVLLKKIQKNDLSRIMSPKLAAEKNEILAAFRELNTQNLSPVFEYFQGKFSYDELRVARMMCGE